MKISLMFIILFLLINTLSCSGQPISVMIAIDEKLPSAINGKAFEQLAKYMEQQGFKIIIFPEEQRSNMGNLICQLVENNDEKLTKIAKDRGAMFLICGKLQAMETGTTTIYNTTLNQIEVFGEINLFYLKKNEFPINIKLKEKGLSVKLQDSYQQALGKALESIEQSIISAFR